MVNFNELEQSLEEDGVAIYRPYGNNQFVFDILKKYFPNCDVDIDCDNDIIITEK